ncbi:NUDIX domain-containing protein [Nostoc ellipsosporum NOK]|jgi:8-oxo-dGTP diphosphatase|nr:NUDIX domain-containing protein [Nostoc ellipsosporum NOK]
MKENDIRPAVAAAVFNDKGQILLQKRKDVNRWGLISGHVEFGESVEEAILREIGEETGTKGELVRLIGVYSSPRSQTYFYTDKTVQYITTYFEARLQNEIAEDFSNEETLALQFFYPDQIPMNELAQLHPEWLNDALSPEAAVYVR